MRVVLVIPETRILVLTMYDDYCCLVVLIDSCNIPYECHVSVLLARVVPNLSREHYGHTSDNRLVHLLFDERIRHYDRDIEL